LRELFLPVRLAFTREWKASRISFCPRNHDASDRVAPDIPAFLSGNFRHGFCSKATVPWN
jgi:hypothetical protein